MRWRRAGIAGGTATAATVWILVAAVTLGLRIPGLGFLRPFSDGSGLDYSAAPAGSFARLRAGFVDRILGTRYEKPEPRFSGLPPGGDAVVPRGSAVITRVATPDDWENAQEVGSVPYTATTDTTSGSRETGEPDTCSPVGSTVWFRYRSPTDEGLIAGTDGSDYATALGVFTGSGMRALRSQGCNTSAAGDAHVPFVALRGTVYYFQVTAPVRGGHLVFGLRRQPALSLGSLSSRGSRNGGWNDNAHLSENGRYLVFDSDAPNLDPRCPCGEQVYLRDLAAGTTELVSQSSNGVVAKHTGGFAEGEASVSEDGRTVVFASWAPNLVPGDTNGLLDVFVRDRVAKTTRRISLAWNGKQGTDGPRGAFNSHISADGRAVVFWSDFRGLDRRYPNSWGIYRVDLHSDRVEYVSVSRGEPANEEAFAPTISANGRYIGFESLATNLVDDPGLRTTLLRTYNETIPIVGHRLPYPANIVTGQFWTGEVYVHDMKTGKTTLECVSQSGDPADSDCVDGEMSADGRYIVLISAATNLLPAAEVDPGTVGLTQVYVRDRTTGHMEIASVSSSGQVGGDSGNYSQYPIVRELADRGVGDPRRNNANLNTFADISADGRWVAFDSGAPNLVEDDTNGVEDIFVHDRITGRTVRISETTDGVEADHPCYHPVLSGDGSLAAFVTDADNLVSGDTNGQRDVVLWAQ